MALTKAELAKKLYARTGFSKEKSVKIVESTLELMKKELEEGKDVLISGFGRWSVKAKSPRRGRNPQTGKGLTLDARRVVTFRCSRKLKDDMNS
ncbi:MAG: integration host factor subunit alpha [Deltaproteobacteria bacterium]|nr:integration host factor subunit alpha [Deltaproteobacteria bacterium]MBW2649139.1 integration host factor subunit alpha [Deltaproteobacteria bacterium]